MKSYWEGREHVCKKVMMWISDTIVLQHTMSQDDNLGMFVEGYLGLSYAETMMSMTFSVYLF